MSDGTLPLPNAVWTLAIAVGFRILKPTPNVLSFRGRLIWKETVISSQTVKGAHSDARVKISLEQSQKRHKKRGLKLPNWKIYSTL